MSILSLIFKNENAQLLLSAVALLFMFYALGRIVQKHLRLNRSNVYMSIPIGLLTYMIVNQLIYTPILVTGIGVETLSAVDTLKGISVLLFIIISYDAWLPRLSWIGTKTLLLVILTIGIVFLNYWLFSYFDQNFASINSDWVNKIDSITTENYYNNGGSIGDIETIVSKYKSIYYWIYINANSSMASTTKVVNVEMTVVWLIAISLAIQSSFINHEKSFLSVTLSIIISIFATTILGYISPTSDMFYTISIALIVTLIMYDYSIKQMPSDQTISIGLLSVAAFVTVGTNSFTYIFIFGIALILLSAIRGGNIVKNTINYLYLILSTIFLYTLTIFIYDVAYIRTILIYLVMLAIIFLLMFLPLYSIGYTPSRREELVKFENTIKTKMWLIITIASTAFTIMSLFIGWINHVDISTLLESFFSDINILSNKWVWGMIGYISLILIPSIIITVLWKRGVTNYLLGLFAFINLLFNPITLVTFSNILNINHVGNILLLYWIFIITIFSLKEIVTRIPTLH